MTSRAPQTAEKRSTCQECGGIGLIRTAPNASKPCSCQVAQGIASRLQRAFFPAAFESADFAGYKVDPNNQRAVDLAKKYIAAFIPGNTEIGLMFTGTVGTGKTHLAIAIARQLIEERGITARFVDIRALLDRLRSSYDQGSSETQGKILGPILQTDLVIIDELGAARPSDWVFETQELLIGTLYNNKTPVIVTTNLANLAAGKSIDENEYARSVRPETLGDRIGARMFSRLQQMCIEAKLQGPDRRAKK
jgi:DNA replication protein DnaC